MSNVKMSEEAKEELKNSPGFKNLVQSRHDFNELMNHPGYQVFMDWVKVQIDGYRYNAVYDDDPVKRERDRVYVLALEKFCRMPQFIGDLLQEDVSSDVAS